MVRQRPVGLTAQVLVPPGKESTPAAPAARASWPPKDETPELFPSSHRILQLSEGHSEAAVLTADAGADGHAQATLWLIDGHTAEPRASEIFSGADPEEVASPVWIWSDTALLYQFSAGGCVSSFQEGCGIYILTIASGKKDKLLDHRTAGLAVSPRWDHVAFWDYTAGDQLTVFDVHKKQIVRVWSNQPHGANDLLAKEMAFSPDGKSLFARTYDRGAFALKEFNIQSGDVKLVAPNVIGPVSARDGVYFIDRGPSEKGATQQSSRLLRISSSGSDPVEVVSPFPYETLASNSSPFWVVAYGAESGLVMYDIGSQSGYTVGKGCQFATFLMNRPHYTLGNKLVGDPKDCGIPPRSPFWGPRMAEKVSGMKALQERIVKADSAHEKASAWFEMNRTARELAKLMNGEHGPWFAEQFEKLGETAGAFGVELRYCEIGADWGALPTGYEKYLESWPDGPLADEAWWQSRVELWCGDFEPSVEEYKAGVDLYTEFLKRFPNSAHAAEARNRLEEYRAGLEEEREHERPKKLKKP